MVKQYIKRPIMIEAVQCIDLNKPGEIASWCGGKVCGVGDVTAKVWIEIPTLEGVMKATYGDYIIKGVNGEFYPCKPDIFEKTYKEVLG